MSHARLPQCLIVQPIHETGVDILKQAGLAPCFASASDMKTVAREIAEADAVITRDAGLSRAAIAAAPRLRVIGVHGSGSDPVDVDFAHRRGISVLTTPGTNARSVAEHAIALMLAVARRIPMADASVRGLQRGFRDGRRFEELHGKTLCIVGWGRIGRLTAQIARLGFGMEILVHSPRSDPTVIAEEGGLKVGSLRDALSRADAVSLHVPLREETRRMIGRDELAAMKPEAILVNTCRGAVVDETALAEALSARRIAGAGLDVFSVAPDSADHPLLRFDNVVLTPHLGGTTEAALRRTAEAVAHKVVAALAGEIAEDAFGFRPGQGEPAP